MTFVSFHGAHRPFEFRMLSALLERLRFTSPRRPVRDMIIAGFLVLSATAIVYAEEHLQAWIPDVLSMPEDAEVVMDRAIGSTVRMFSIATDADVEALFADWEESLRTNGYIVMPADGELLQRLIEFSGPGIANAKIILAPATPDDTNLIEFDATLN